MILGLLWMAVANVASVYGSAALLRKVRTPDAATNLLLFLLLRLALISTGVLFAGLTGGLTPWGLGFLGLACLGGLMAWGPRELWSLPSLKGHLAPALTALFVLIAVKLLIQVWCFSPILMDALSYHLPKVAEWVQAGRMTREMGVDPHSALPAGFELIEIWWVVFLHHDVLIELAGLEFLVVGAAAVLVLARRSGLDGRWSLFAAALYLLTPALQCQAVSCLNDAPVSAVFLATLALVMVRAPVEALLLAAGMGMGIKPTFLYMLPGAVLLWALFARRQAPLAAQSRRWALALVALGLVLGLFWYGRNLAWYGNPIYPIGSQGLIDSAGNEQIQFGPRLGSFIDNVSSLANDRLYDRERPYGPLLVRSAGWGAVAVGVGLLALLETLRRGGPLRSQAAAFACAMASVLLLVRNDDWSMRHILFFPAILSIAASHLAFRCRPILAVLLLGLAFDFAGTLLPATLPAPRVAALWRQGWRDRSASPFFEIALGPEAVGCFATDLGTPYLLYGSDFSRQVVYLRVSSARELLRTLRAEKIRYLYAAPESKTEVDVMTQAVRSGEIVNVGGFVYAVK